MLIVVITTNIKIFDDGDDTQIITMKIHSKNFQTK